MKKTVFLLFLTLIFVINVDFEVNGSGVTYVVNNEEIIITSINENGVKGFTIEKTGVNPFNTTIIDDSEYYFITGVKLIDDYYVLYGWICQKFKY